MTTNPDWYDSRWFAQSWFTEWFPGQTTQPAPTSSAGGGSGNGGLPVMGAQWHRKSEAETAVAMGIEQELAREPGDVEAVQVQYERRMLYLRRQLARLRKQIEGLENLHVDDISQRTRVRMELDRLHGLLRAMTDALATQAAEAEAAAQRERAARRRAGRRLAASQHRLMAAQQRLATTQQALAGAEAQVRTLSTSRSLRGRRQLALAVGLCALAEVIPRKRKPWRRATYGAAAACGLMGLWNLAGAA